MDYTDDACMIEFTTEQINRVRCTLANFRVDLGDSGPPAAATSPAPGDGATSVSGTTNLSWSAGSGATSHDVYFGTTSNPGFVGNQTATSYDPPGLLDPQTTYYWRIDEVNSSGTTTGVVWSFTTR